MGCELAGPVLAVGSLEPRYLHVAVEYQARRRVVLVVNGRDRRNDSGYPENSLIRRRNRRSGLSCIAGATNLPTAVTPPPFPLLRELNLFTIVESCEGSIGTPTTVPRANGSRLTYPRPCNLLQKGRPANRSFGSGAADEHLMA